MALLAMPAVAVAINHVGVTLERTNNKHTEDEHFWTDIRTRTSRLRFKPYQRYMEWLFCGEPWPKDLLGNAPMASPEPLTKSRLFMPFHNVDPYRAVKVATEAFLMVNCAAAPTGGMHYYTEDVAGPGSGTTDVIPYLEVIRRKLPEVDLKKFKIDIPTSINDRKQEDCYGLLVDKLQKPCMIELIWSYWHEEGMLVQTMNALMRRFQNVRGRGANDPLANLEIDPLRPLNNLLWGYLQDEQHQLSVMRRSYEYDHHYGLRLVGRAVRGMRPADSRSKFLEAFHNLLALTADFYKRDDDTTVKADAFPVLNALKDVHLILSQGAHNQFGDLPSTARIEMMVQQWLLARPEFREVIPTRLMVAYPEPWMDRVDAMKRMQGWTDTSVMHFSNLANFGEQTLLGVRWGNWNDIHDPDSAGNWARAWRAEIQGYIHAYRTVTGVDLTAIPVGTAVNATLPSVLLSQRMSDQLARIGAR